MEKSVQDVEEGTQTGLSKNGLLKHYDAEVVAKTLPQFRNGTPKKMRRSAKRED